MSAGRGVGLLSDSQAHVKGKGKWGSSVILLSAVVLTAQHDPKVIRLGSVTQLLLTD